MISNAVSFRRHVHRKGEQSPAEEPVAIPRDLPRVLRRRGVRRIGVVEPLKAELRARQRRSQRLGDALTFGRTAEAPFVPSTVRRRALDAWEAENDRRAEEARRRGVTPELLEPLRLHEGRHTTGTDGGFAGLDDKSLAHLMGHSSVVITKDRYGHMTDDVIREATRKLNAYHERALDVDTVRQG